MKTPKAADNLVLSKKTVLVFDTNFYIANLQNIEKMHLNNLIICVPLIVFKELRGLVHSERAGKEATAAIKWIEEAKLHLMTSRGSKLREHMSEEWETNDSADDVIVRTCLTFQSVDGCAPVALISLDANIRIKAKSCGLYASKNVSDFEYLFEKEGYLGLGGSACIELDERLNAILLMTMAELLEFSVQKLMMDLTEPMKQLII